MCIGGDRDLAILTAFYGIGARALTAVFKHHDLPAGGYRCRTI